MTAIKPKERLESLRRSLFPDEVALLYKQQKQQLYNENDKPEVLLICNCSNKKHEVKQQARQYICPDCHKKWVFKNKDVMKLTSDIPNHMQYVNIPNSTKTIVETTQDDHYIKLEINTITNQFKILKENNKQAKYRLHKKYKEIDMTNRYQHVDDRLVLSVFRHIYISTIRIIYDINRNIIYKYIYDNQTKNPRVVNNSYIDFDNNSSFKKQVEAQSYKSSTVIGKINNKIFNEIQTNGFDQVHEAINIMYTPWLEAVSKATGKTIKSLSDLAAFVACTNLKTLRRIIGRNKTEKEFLQNLQINMNYHDDNDDIMYGSILRDNMTLASTLPSNLYKKMAYLDKANDQIDLRDMTKYLFTNASKNETKYIHQLYEKMSSNPYTIVNVLVIHFIYYAHMYINDPHKRNTIYQVLIDNIGSTNNNSISYFIEYMRSISKLSVTNKTKTRLIELLVATVTNKKHDITTKSNLNYITVDTILNIQDTINSIRSVTKILHMVRPISSQKRIKQSIEDYITKIETNNSEHFDNKINSMVFLINDKFPILEQYSKKYYHDFDFNYDHIDPSIFTKQIGRFDLYLPSSSYDLRRIGQLLKICVGNGYYADKVKNKMGLIVILKDRYSEKLTCMEIHIGKTKNKKLKYTLIQAKGPYNNQNFPLPIDVIQTITDFCTKNKINIECHYDLKHPLKLKKII